MKKADFKKKVLSLVKGVRRHYLKWLVLMTPLFMVGALPILTRWVKEKVGVYLYDLVLPLFLVFLTSLIVASFFIRLYLRNRFAALVGALLSAVSMGPLYLKIHGFLAKNGFLINTVLETLVFMTGILFASYVFGFLVDKYTSKWQKVTNVLAKSIFIVAGVAFFIQFFAFLKVAVPSWKQYFYQPPSFSFKETDKNSEKPDIYYIVLDRYTNDKVLKEQFGYDNSDFTNFLKSNGFYVKEDAYSAYPYTTFSISSTMNANYQSDIVERFGNASENTYIPYHNAVRHNSAAKYLKSAGYKYYQFGTWFEATNYSPSADELFQETGRLNVLGRTFILNSFVRQDISQSVYNNFFKRGFKVGSLELLSFAEKPSNKNTISSLANLKKVANSQPGGKFVFAHYLLPHDPFYFNADGSENKHYGNNNVGKPVKEKYIDQVKFINSEVKEVVSAALKKSNGKAVIVLLADEGAWPTKMNLEKAASPANDNAEVTISLPADMRKWTDKDLQMKYGVLAAYHIPKAEKKDIKNNLNSVNVFRVIFNSYFDSSLPFLPECYYGFPKGARSAPFTYVDLTKNLTGKDNPACAPDSNFSK